MPEYILKERVLKIVQRHETPNGNPDMRYTKAYNRCANDIRNAIQTITPVSVEGDLVERLERVDRVRQGHRGPIPIFVNPDGPEAAQAITVLQAELAEQRSLNSDMLDLVPHASFT